MRTRLMCLGVAALLVVRGWAASPFDYEYDVTDDTYLLLHFGETLTVGGQGGKAGAELFGGARLSPNGWLGQALEPGLTGGLLVQPDRPFQGNRYEHLAMEARVFLRQYPTNRAFIVDKVFRCANPVVHNMDPQEAAVGLSLFIDPDGRIGNEITSLYYGPTHRRTFHSREGFAFPTNRWVHVALVNAQWPASKYVMLVDREPVLRLPHDYTMRVFYGKPRDNVPGPIVIGNNEAHDSPFPGLIDEVRILENNLELLPAADLSWTDPDGGRPRPPDETVLLPRSRPVVRVSFDEGEQISTTDTNRFRGLFKGGTFTDGVRGRAYAGGELQLCGEGVASGREGTIEFWMMPENWNNKMVQNLSFLSGGPAPFFTWYVMNSSGDLRPISLYFENDQGKNVFISFDKLLPEQDWHHLVLTWKGPRFRIYHNGQRMVESEPRDISRAVEVVRDQLSFRGRAGNKTTRFDEIAVYPRQLSSSEVQNAYHRYRDPSRLVKPTPYSVVFKPYPSLHEVRAEIGFDLEDAPRALRLKAAQGSRAVAGPAVTVSGEAGVAAAVVDTSSLGEGSVDLTLEVLDAEGRVVDGVAGAFTKRGYPWLGNRLGVPKTVPEPWVPLTGRRDRVRCLRTEYDFGRGLVGQVATDGAELLAAPIEFQAETPGGAVPLKSRTRVKVREAGLAADLDQAFTGGGLDIRVAGRMDFDGFIDYTLRLGAGRGEVRVERLSLRIPVRADQARDYYVLGEHMDHMAQQVPVEDGVFWDSLNSKMFARHNLPRYAAMQRPKRELRYGSFVPFAWIGSHRQGLCFMADNDRGWVQDDEVPALVYRREGDTVWLELNLLADAVTLTADRPREVRLSLMATPTKRPARGWRHWRTDSFYPTTGSGRALDGKLLYAPYPADYEASKAFFDGKWEQGITPLPYTDFYGSDGRMPPAEDFRWEWFPGITGDEFPKRSSIYRANYGTGSLIDWYVFKLNEWVDRCGANGLYIDNAYPSPLPYAVTGPGYVHEKGEVQAGYPMFAMREYFKRLYCLLAAKGRPHPYLMIHMTHTMVGPAMSFADIAYEGEDHYLGPAKQEVEGADHITYWPNHIVRIVDYPHAWGLGTFWLGAVHGDPAEWKLPPSREYYIRAWYTQLLLHDMRGSIAKDDGLMAVFTTFLDQDPDVEFVLYRDNTAIAAAPAADIFVSYYRRPGRVLAVVGNHAQEGRSLVLSIDAAALGLKAAEVVDAETGERLGDAASPLPVTVARRNFRLLLIREP